MLERETITSKIQSGICILLVLSLLLAFVPRAEGMPERAEPVVYEMVCEYETKRDAR